MLRFIPVLFVLSCLSILFGCASKEANLEVKIKDVSWKEESKVVHNRHETYYKTTITIEDDRKLTFEGIHDFKIGNTYKIKVREYDAGLVKFENISARKEEAKTFKPTTNSDKIVFKVVVDKSGNILASEEVGPEPKASEAKK